ncbi:MAG: bifunctional DNA-formamidopyrimidine glycosylase/DNA-(apurinic or apyrimidinic site) lyase [Solirubrobacterales bacterium]
MPELPEVETVRRQLDPEVSGRGVESVEILDHYFTKPHDPRQFEKSVTGRTFEGVGRRGKYLLLGFDDGDTLVIHLRMTGNLVLAEGEEERPAPDGRIYRPPKGEHLKARFRLEDGVELRFYDPRRFGRGFVATPAELEDYLGQRLGVEPLSEDFTVEELARVTAGRTGPLKSLLLNQAAVAGIGNIYADEALHRASLHPLSPGGSMKPEHHEALHTGIVGALQRGVELGGASIDDYRDARGTNGSMQEEFLVHLREGEDCLGCGGTVTRIVVGGRSTYYCPECQVRLRRKPRRRRG